MESKITTITSNATYTAGAATATGGLLSFNEWIMLSGFLLGLATFGLNWYYQDKRLKILESQ